MRHLNRKFKNFCFCTKHCNKANLRVLTLNMTVTIFQNCCPKYTNQESGIFGSKFKNFYFYTKLCDLKNLRLLQI